MLKKIERGETSQEALGIVDIKSGNFRFHWTKIDWLRRKLTRGIYSLEFARKIEDREYTVRASSKFPQPLGPGGKSWEHFVFISDALSTVFTLQKSPRSRAREDPTKLIGIVLRGESGSLEVPLRIAPRQFIGLVIVDMARPFDPSRASWTQTLRDSDLRETHIAAMLAEIEGAYDSGVSRNGRLPVYGYSGGLYLPQRMSYEEVLKTTSNLVQ